MILIYAASVTPRLEYILSFIFHDFLKISYRLTNDLKELDIFEGAKINYDHPDSEGCFHIVPEILLFEKGIHPQEINIFHHNQYLTFFNKNTGYAFDVFAASFYLLSRYEEYLPFEEDEYGRYPHKNSVAYKHNFLHLPLINIWLNDFANTLLEMFPGLQFKKNDFKFTPTYDIDIAWSYLHKGFIRNTGGFIKRPCMKRIRVLLKKEKDPFDVYEALHELHQQNHLHPVYFFLVAKQAGMYDKNISPDNDAMQKLIKEHVKYTLGVHPSWQSFKQPDLITSEKIQLGEIADIPIIHSRQHYIKLSLPETYCHLIKAGITDDHSMGYGSINGFRASVAQTFFWYDLLNEKTTNLRLHPFCFMDANSLFEQHQTVEKSYEELISYYEICKNNNGHLITIFHNHILGTDLFYKGWMKMYKKFTSHFQQ